ncbi:M15 family metallopeptidase [Zeaxanthinibacter sp. PT1]|uniref:M15 family metallopeptidase n=1 Tax=Zeaxanthinibacter TaxID=561554 RepID=UPI002349A672|nr:M15 family metallopeptidase [Zeaxanthinibacter sp. PT1]MDC6350697.1 M15 family metallopeptidase [Zeaxanthinibacter sp. PT1]
MVTSRECIQVFGRPTVKFEYAHMEVYHTSFEERKAIPCLPERIYMNRQMVKPFRQGLRNAIDRDVACEILTWDGCFVVRKMRGKDAWSLHSWGIAFDINREWNELHQKPTMSPELVKCFTDAGFEWGGYWEDPIDGMHFQLAKIQ